MHPQSSELFNVYEVGVEYLSRMLSHLKSGIPQAQLLSLRCLANLFNTNAGIFLARSKRQWILDSVSQFATSDNKNVRNAVITIFLK